MALLVPPAGWLWLETLVGNAGSSPSHALTASLLLVFPGWLLFRFFGRSVRLFPYLFALLFQGLFVLPVALAIDRGLARWLGERIDPSHLGLAIASTVGFLAAAMGRPHPGSERPAGEDPGEPLSETLFAVVAVLAPTIAFAENPAETVSAHFVLVASGLVGALASSLLRTGIVSMKLVTRTLWAPLVLAAPCGQPMPLPIASMIGLGGSLLLFLPDIPPRRRIPDSALWTMAFFAVSGAAAAPWWDAGAPREMGFRAWCLLGPVAYLLWGWLSGAVFQGILSRATRFRLEPEEERAGLDFIELGLKRNGTDREDGRTP
ncbi:MAG: hypothetical protein H6686_01520 [Fibrobacteria bacterium]|nr:hypothetical protein [Fibrobacteria bacterium]